MPVTVREPGFRTVRVYGIASPPPPSSASAVRSSPSAAVGGPISATCAAAADRAGVACAWIHATLRTSTVSRTVGATASTRSIAPLPPAARVPSDQLSTCPATAGAVVALTYCRPPGRGAGRAAVWGGAGPAAVPEIRGYLALCPRCA